LDGSPLLASSFGRLEMTRIVGLMLLPLEIAYRMRCIDAQQKRVAEPISRNAF
jgi:hypothetical protein